MTYSVSWIPTENSFNNRFDVYLDHYFFEDQVPSMSYQFFSAYSCKQSHIYTSNLFHFLRVLVLTLRLVFLDNATEVLSRNLVLQPSEFCTSVNVYIFIFHFWQIHWFSIFNSLVIVIFLVGLISKILMRTLCHEDGKDTQDNIDLGLLVIFDGYLYDLNMFRDVLTHLFP